MHSVADAHPSGRSALFVLVWWSWRAAEGSRTRPKRETEAAHLHSDHSRSGIAAKRSQLYKDHEPLLFFLFMSLFIRASSASQFSFVACRLREVWSAAAQMKPTDRRKREHRNRRATCSERPATRARRDATPPAPHRRTNDTEEDGHRRTTDDGQCRAGTLLVLHAARGVVSTRCFLVHLAGR